jgi:hypothetical protein
MGGLPREEANRVVSNTDACYEYDPNVSSFKYYSNGTPRATSISNARNAYNKSVLRNEVYHAASASVRQINYQHLLHNEAAAAAWLDNTRKERARDLLNTPVTRTSLCNSPKTCRQWCEANERHLPQSQPGKEGFSASKQNSKQPKAKGSSLPN